MTLEELYSIIEDRIKRKPKNSYVASLVKDGIDRIVQKVGEEAIEVVIAAKNKQKTQLILEVADLWFHSLILLAEKNIKVEDVLKELQKRHKPSLS